MNEEDREKAAEIMERLEEIKMEGMEERAMESKRKKREIAEGMVTMPELNGALFIHNNMSTSSTDVAALLEVLSEEAEKVIHGDDSSIQRYLFTQLHVTDKLFHRFAGLMMSPDNQGVAQFKLLGDMAAKFQNMSRRTAATLVDIKRPRQKTYIRRVDQLNTAQNQQVNNSTEAEKLSENEVSGDIHVETLDAGTEAAAIGADTHLEAVGEGYGAKDPQRQGEVVHERPEDG